MKFYRTLHPRPVAIIGSGDTNKEINFMACSWITPIAEDISALGFACDKGHYTYELIQKYKQFSVNIVEDLDLIWKVGTSSGKEINKAETFNIKFKSGKALSVPLIEGALANLECKVIKDVEIGEVMFYIGEVKHWKAQNFDEYGYKEFWKVPLHKSGKAFAFPSKKLRFLK
ncbi:flavin reductase family protein [Thermodesulfobacterium hydrogeniphilum]|uniref:flavin reductase family protein n=1 Tax=Thermodesulfobacterium hydrogeniphilum TaxID=161156 RepID=UPI00068EF46B|nr:flavin reductase family protein [Thermodesulfobacterium hydrogeniphilum]